MKIRFHKRISGICEIAYSCVEKEAKHYRVLEYGDPYEFRGEKHTFECRAGLELDGSIYELKPGSLVIVKIKMPW